MKIVMIINDELPTGLAMNTAAVLGISLGRLNKKIVGSDLIDKSETKHFGITNTPVPILSANKTEIKKIYITSLSYDEIQVIDFSKTAQTSLDYKDYQDKLKNLATDQIQMSGICISGPVKKVKKLTSSLKLYG